MFGIGYKALANFGNFDPSQLSDLTAWYRADSVILSGSKVSQLTDKSVNGYHAVQADTNHQPTYTAVDSSFNNQPTMTYGAGTQTWLTYAGTGSFILQQPATMYIVCTITAIPGGGGGDIMFDSDNDVSNRMVIWAYNNGGFSWALYCGTIAQSSILVNPPTVPTIAAATFTGGNGVLYLNALTSVYGPVSVGSQGLKSITIGSEEAQTATFNHTGKIAEIVWCSTTHDANTIKKVMNYFGTRYNITVGA